MQQIFGVHLIGSYREGTILKNDKTADIVVIFRLLPLKATVQAIGNKIMEDIKNSGAQSTYMVEFCDDHLVVSTSNPELGRIIIHFATTPDNIKKLTNPEIQVSKLSIVRSLMAIDQANWFDQFVKGHIEVINLIRLLKYITKQYPDFRLITSWMITNLANYCMTYTADGSHLSSAAAFRRVFQLMSAGIFLPYSSSISDPLNPVIPIYGELTVQTLEKITACAQTMLRLMGYPGGINYILDVPPLPQTNLDKNPFEIPTVWGNVTVTPSVAVLLDGKKESEKV